MTSIQKINSHPMFSLEDYEYLTDKGYTNEEILSLWDRDHKRGCSPVTVNKNKTSFPDVVSYVSGI